MDDYLHAWSTPQHLWDELEYRAYIFNAPTCATIADAMTEPSARLNWAAAVQKRLIEALELATT